MVFYPPVSVGTTSTGFLPAKIGFLKHGDAYVNTVHGALTTGWVFPVMVIGGFISGVIGGMIGKSVMKKHFEKSGLV